jgi:hypothetical protein
MNKNAAQRIIEEAFELKLESTIKQYIYVLQ